MSQNIGTLITSAIRPNDSLDPIASAWGNEIKGGHHVYSTLAERDAIILNRRDWGMLVTIYNDVTPSNNKTYQLSYNYSNTNISDNGNWIQYNPNSTVGNSGTTEWTDSVLDVTSSPITSNNGDRYLVATGSNSGVFSGQSNKIAQYDSGLNSGYGGWVFHTPTKGTTVRVDTQNNCLYKYDGVNWYKEYLNQVRFIQPTSTNGLTYSFINTIQTPLGNYQNTILYATFGMTNSGTSSLQIDGLPSIEIKKVSNNNLIGLVSGDIVTNMEYQLIYNGTYFQTTLPTDTNVIGSAEDGTYLDGLYVDFTANTLIGTAVDRFNQVLKNLVPPSAPTLSSWSANGSFVSGKLSFDNSIGGFVGATGSPYGSVGLGGIFSASAYRLGIMSGSTQPLTGNIYYNDISGILNSLVVQSGTTPTPAYATYSFGNANIGTMSLLLNGTLLSAVGLTSVSSPFDTTTSGSNSGLVISSATNSKFPIGTPFSGFWNRTGNWLVKKNDANLVNGYNYIVVKHDTPSTSYVLNRYEFVIDNSTQSVAVNSPVINNINTIATKYLSGIRYINTVNFRYITSGISNAVSNTFNLSNSAVGFTDVSQSLTVANGVVSSTNTNYPIFSPSLSGVPITISGPITPTSTISPSMTFSVNSSSSVRRINDNIGTNITVLRTVQGAFVGATAQLGNWFIDTYPNSSTFLLENFDDESYRLKNIAGANNKYNCYNFTSDISVNMWGASSSLLTDTSHYNGLQVINGQLLYPKFSFNSPGTSTSNPNYNNSNLDYFNCSTLYTGFGTSSISSSNYRTYTRYFYVGTSVNYSRIKMNMNWFGTQFVNAITPINSTNTNIWVEFKLPYSSGTPNAGTQSSGSVTGWMDATKPFATSQYGDNSGCLDGSVPSSTGGDWLINFGIQGTQWSGGYIMLRITAGPYWTGYIDSITITPY
jgi:hypothetical protein